jgi:hypothetical protein
MSSLVSQSRWWSRKTSSGTKRCRIRPSSARRRSSVDFAKRSESVSLGSRLATERSYVPNGADSSALNLSQSDWRRSTVDVYDLATAAASRFVQSSWSILGPLSVGRRARAARLSALQAAPDSRRACLAQTHLVLGRAAPISRHFDRPPTTSKSMTSWTYSLAWVASSPWPAPSEVEKSSSWRGSWTRSSRAAWILPEAVRTGDG